jgi:drug/metabolite transporter (DMT)-like permease
MVLPLALCWGSNWIASAIALRDVPPWSLRFASTSIAAAGLIVAIYLSGRSLRLPPGTFKHVAVAGICNVALFNICSAFSQLSGATSRTIIITYSMPIWSAVGAWLVLGDRFDRVRLIALALCVSGLTVLLWPLFATGIPRSALIAFGSAFGWAFATVYLKWADARIDPLINAAWQLAIGTVFITIGMMFVDGTPRLGSIGPEIWGAIVFIGLIGTGVPHFLWWSIVAKLPTATAALGSLLVPVFGISASVLLLGERPTATDVIGFTMIFAAAACVLLQPGAKPPEPE